MAKRKDLLLTESTTMRMMGLAGIGSLANPFLKEQSDKFGDSEHTYHGQSRQAPDDQEEEQEMDEMMGHGYEEEMDENVGLPMYEEDEEENEEEDEEENEEEDEEEDEEDEYDDEEDEEEDYEDDEENELEEGKVCEVCKNSPCSCKMEENIQESMKRLKKLLEQAEAPAPETAEAPVAEPPPALEGGDEMETKIKEFVKKLGELVQETLGVEVTVEEGEGEPKAEEAPAELPPPEEGSAPAPMAEAINRLVNKVAARVKARLMEAKKDPKVAAAKAKKMKMMKEKQMAAKKKEKEDAAKKKEMEMKKKKAAMAKKK